MLHPPKKERDVHFLLHFEYWINFPDLINYFWTSYFTNKAPSLHVDVFLLFVDKNL